MSVRKRLVGLGLALALTLATLVATTPSASAAVGSSTTCTRTGDVSHTNDWHFFWSRKIRAYERACIKMASVSGRNFPMLTYVRTPSITYPSAWPVPSGERVSTTEGMHVTSKGYTLGKLTRVTWGWSAKSCVAICQDWDFRLKVDGLGTQLCVVGGSCDPKKWW